MLEKPTTADEYSISHVSLVKKVCLYLATKLGDYIDNVVVVGGLVPYLLIDQENLPEGTSEHVGTIDLDLGLALAILDDHRYQAITTRLRQAGFKQDVNELGNPTRQRWKVECPEKVTVDFLIPPLSSKDEGGKIRDIEPDFAAVITPGLRFAFQDKINIELEGETIFGEKTKRNIWVCGPGAFVILKALAFRKRGENKDAYDLYYVIRNYGKSVEQVAKALKPFLQEREGKECLEILNADFTLHQGPGPIRVAQFLIGGSNDIIQADVVGFISLLMKSCKQ
ncbi:nucleotidyl transferase AbiEii/AbiGii toxin family protein [candidate division CSSED10-310 bacterium]|uniref:Nucleotidyl transferase AbiEii/AbiGii toxin family protein n=1 Tax=candidate division CSSED10-310 bacterium TaxID=2855610 RepID=A0ABV6Z1A0_UNCC1